MNEHPQKTQNWVWKCYKAFPTFFESCPDSPFNVQILKIFKGSGYGDYEICSKTQGIRLEEKDHCMKTLRNTFVACMKNQKQWQRNWYSCLEIISAYFMIFRKMKQIYREYRQCLKRFFYFFRNGWEICKWEF